MLTYAIWNNKGGTGKTSLTFQAVCTYAKQKPMERILVIDMCPQANLSELMLGGQANKGSANLLQRHGMTPRCSIGGYFDARIPAAFIPPIFDAKNYITPVKNYNSSIPSNIDLVCGDPLLELQSIAMSSLSNIDLPGVNTWLGVIDWLRNFLVQVEDQYDMVFIDTNPSFSMYTQIALSSADRIILPVMADDSSRRAIQNAFSLIYGVKLPSDIYEKYTFAKKLGVANRTMPKIHLILKNRLTQYMGKASAFTAVLQGIDDDLKDLMSAHPNFFTFNNVIDGIVDVRDFSTTGVVAFARGCPFDVLPSGKLMIGGLRVQVKPEYLENAKVAIGGIVAKL